MSDPNALQFTGNQTVSVLLGIILFIARGKVSAWDKNLVESTERDKQFAVLKTNVETMAKQMDLVHSEQAWLGEVMIKISTKLNVQIPSRPLARQFEERGAQR